jgi:hypothetical protein
LKKKGLKAERITKVGLYAIGTSTTLESNKSLLHMGVVKALLRNNAARIVDKLWRVIAITREYAPQFQAHLILEAPDRERLSLTCRDATARILVQHDVIELEPKREIPADIPDEALGDAFIPQRAKWGEAALVEGASQV